jgi:pyruvate kinase
MPASCQHDIFIIFDKTKYLCRLNFSHGEYEQVAAIVENVIKINNESGYSISLMADLQGPKLRVGNMSDHGVMLNVGEKVIITNEEVFGTEACFTLRYPLLSQDLKPGERILLDDGKMEVEIGAILSEKEVEAFVIRGGVLKSKKGFNLPGSNVSLPALTEKDLADLQFALSLDVDWVALSFVRRAADVQELKDIIAASGKTARVIAKIEKPEAVSNIDTIIDVADAIMIARGDLGIEMPLQEVPVLQKNIIQKCIAAAKPVIVATQMMESMMESTIPSRAEVTDVANAVIDGADAVMLSGETSVGKYPVLTVATMDKIITDVERDSRPYIRGTQPKCCGHTFVSDEICYTATRMSAHMSAKGIVVMTQSGSSALRVSSYRPKSPVFVFSENSKLLRTLNLAWGIRGFHYDNYASTDQSITDTIEILKSGNIVNKGDVLIHTASMPIGKRERANALKVSVVAD